MPADDKGASGESLAVLSGKGPLKGNSAESHAGLVCLVLLAKKGV